MVRSLSISMNFSISCRTNLLIYEEYSYKTNNQLFMSLAAEMSFDILFDLIDKFVVETMNETQ
jgi:hypothetical protein